VINPRLTWIECLVVSYWRAETIQTEIPSQLLRESREKSPAIHCNGHCESVMAADRSRDDDARRHAARMGGQAAAAIIFRRRRPP
jgi:hypothetical protein